MGLIVKILLLAVIVFRVIPAIVRMFLGRDRPPHRSQPAPPRQAERSTLGGSEIVEAEFEDLPGGRS